MRKWKRLFTVLSIIIAVSLFPIYAKNPPFIPSPTLGLKGQVGEHFGSAISRDVFQQNRITESMGRSISIYGSPIVQGLDDFGINFAVDDKIVDLYCVEIKFRNRSPLQSLHTDQMSWNWTQKKIQKEATQAIEFCKRSLVDGACNIVNRGVADDKSLWKIPIGKDSYFYKMIGDDRLYFYDGSNRYRTPNQILNQCDSVIGDLMRISQDKNRVKRILESIRVSDGKVVTDFFDIVDVVSCSPEELAIYKSNGYMIGKGLVLKPTFSKEVSDNLLNSVVNSSGYKNIIQEFLSIEDMSVYDQLSDIQKLNLLDNIADADTCRIFLSSIENSKILSAKLGFSVTVSFKDLNFSDDEIINLFDIFVGNSTVKSESLSHKIDLLKLNSRLAISSKSDLVELGLSSDVIEELIKSKDISNLLNLKPSELRKIYSSAENQQLLIETRRVEAINSGLKGKDLDDTVRQFEKRVQSGNLTDEELVALHRVRVDASDKKAFHDYLVKTSKDAAKYTVKNAALWGTGMFVVDTAYQGFTEGWKFIDWRRSLNAAITFGVMAGVDAVSDYTSDVLQAGLLRSSNKFLNKMGYSAPYAMGVITDTLLDTGVLFLEAYKGNISYEQATKSSIVNGTYNAVLGLVSYGIEEGVTAGLTALSVKFPALLPIARPAGKIAGKVVYIVGSGTKTLIIEPIENKMTVHDLYGSLLAPGYREFVLEWTANEI